MGVLKFFEPTTHATHRKTPTITPTQMHVKFCLRSSSPRLPPLFSQNPCPSRFARVNPKTYVYSQCPTLPKLASALPNASAPLLSPCPTRRRGYPTYIPYPLSHWSALQTQPPPILQDVVSQMVTHPQHREMPHANYCAASYGAG